jgi:hypothetical protein
MSVDASIVVVWLGLVAAAAATVAAVALVGRWRRGTRDAGDVPERDLDEPDLEAHAAAVAASAIIAVENAARARERLAADERAREAAWEAAEEAQRAYRQALHSASEGRGAGQAGRAAGEERDRIVSRAALAAYRRGDLTLDQLREVYRRGSGWDPAQERREREADRLGIAERAARRDFDRAAGVARRAEQAVRVAELAADALVEEAATAAAEAELARASKPRGRRSPRTQ